MNVATCEEMKWDRRGGEGEGNVGALFYLLFNHYLTFKTSTVIKIKISFKNAKNTRLSHCQSICIKKNGNNIGGRGRNDIYIRKSISK